MTDYTKWQENLFDDLTLDELSSQAQGYFEKKSISRNFMETVTFTAENHIIDYILSVVVNFPPEKISFIELKNENEVLLNTNKLEDLQEFLLTRNS